MIFSRWQQRGKVQLECTLELGAYSPTDSKHAFRDFRLEDGYPFLDEQDLDPASWAYHARVDDSSSGLILLNDQSRGWAGGRQDAPSLGSSNVLLGRGPL